MRKNRIIASLMALLMTLSAFSGLCVPVAAADSTDAVWTGLGFYVTQPEDKKLSVTATDPSKFVAGENENEIVSPDGKYTVSAFHDTDAKKDLLKITNNVDKVSYTVLDLEAGTIKYEGGGTTESENYYAIPYPTYIDKILTMDMMLENATHMLFVQKYTGEIACYDKKSEQILFSNPYDVSTCDNKSDAIKHQLMSQIVLKYSDTTGNTKTMYSYVEAAINGQINVKYIKNGIRIEYTLGRQEANYLVPRMITKERFEKMILNVINENPDTPQLVKKRFDAFFMPKDPESETLTTVIDQMYEQYPITKKFPIYVLTTDIKTREIAELEEFIKTYCPDYTYDELDYDHALTEYEGQQKAPANFKMAIEYTLNENGLTARLPANGIRYDATNYTLDTIQILPYMGAGSNENTGYIFLPDGSGSITRFEDYVGKSINVSGTMYGIDYAYHTISGKLQETMRFPVYGIVENAQLTTKVFETIEVPVTPPADDSGDTESGEGNTDTQTPAEGNDNTTEQPSQSTTTVITVPKTYEESRGFLAIIEEGDAMVSIMSTGGSTTHKYFNVVTSFSPRQRDEYRLSDSISAASSSAIIVESKRKYVGSLTIKFVMLTDADIAKDKGLTNTYETTWMGMASAYRDYLMANGVLTRLTADEVKDKLPLYIETFGTVETTEKIASIPVTVDKALTSFEQIKTMYDDLSASGISNINFKLNGYYNGGMYSTVPYKLKWQEAAGGADGFNDLVSYAKEKDFGVYPDFDFEYLTGDEMFDGFTMKEHAIRTIDDRYSSRIMYNSATQAYDIAGVICISPSAFSYLFEGLDKNYSQYNNPSISVSTLGYALNSDFDEDDPYNREDSKALTQQVLSQISDKYTNVMSEGGNVYTLKYIDHLLGASLDSSRYALTSAAVPFLGVVLHGSVNFAGTPINMEGDMNYAFLKAIENGASLYFILSYDNTELLKEDTTLSKYYSVRYDIWKEDVIDIYSRLDKAIGDLQDQLIVDHVFLEGSRVPDADEAEADNNAAQKAEADKNNANISSITKEISNRLAILNGEGKVAYGYTLAAIDNPALIVAAMQLNYKPVGAEETNANGETTFTYNDGLILTLKANKTVTVTLTDESKATAEEKLANAQNQKDETVKFDKYATSLGTIAKVVYENGATFILNYNDFSIVCDVDGIEYTIGGYSFVTIKNNTVYNLNSTDSTVAFRVAGSNAGSTSVASGESASIK